MKIPETSEKIFRQVDFPFPATLPDFRNETKRYFLDQGFRLILEEPNTFIFQRGSVFNNMVTFNPLKWKSKIRIKWNEKNIVAIFEIDPVFQTVTLEEKRMWDAFVLNYQKTMETGASHQQVNAKLLKRTKRAGWGYLLHGALGGLLFGIPSAALAHFTGIHSIVSIGCAFGALFFLMRRAEKVRRKGGSK